MFDVNAVGEEELDLYAQCIEQLEKHSPGAQIFVLIHKMDKIPVSMRQEVFAERQAYISKAPRNRTEVSEFFPTSIIDVTLYNVSSTK